ncbi:MAG: protein-L-isoaspartate(D-aspartate) O-methyltransferase [Candidatus Bathyarchaeota archaeon]|nr:MAG: protein-L-isoaspartate(D-aspartate) O-methyltransferase [Candidatus Bathyarchaeota archaeon]
MTQGKDFKHLRERAVKTLIERGVLRSPNVIKAMRNVPREEFLPESMREEAYIDTPLPIGYKQTISALHMVVIMAEQLELDVGQNVLEIGAGSGYHSAILAEIVGRDTGENRCHVYTIEIIPELAEYAQKNLKQLGYEDIVTVRLGDGTLGYPDFAPYDRILVTAAAPNVPNSLTEQLKVNGLLLIPVGDLYFGQELLKIKKISETKTSTSYLGGVRFVPLTGKHGWDV